MSTTPEQLREVADRLETCEQDWEEKIDDTMPDILRALDAHTMVMITNAVLSEDRLICRAVALSLRLQALRIEQEASECGGNDYCIQCQDEIAAVVRAHWAASEGKS